ncbi:MAG TPA: response regulator [Bacteroidota bacterium]|nr:response regulator [Bacteroidota bacterium]
MEKNKKSKRILLVEDDLVSQFYLKTLLSENGFDVQAVSNGKDALSSFSKEKFDIIILDIQIPIINGIEVTKKIKEKENSKKKKTPIIALTAYSYEEDKKLFIETGMDFCITKPIDEKLLLETIFKLTKNG